jgi:hypothetical protein
MSYAKQVAVYVSYLRAGSEMAALIQANLKRGALPDELVAGFAQAHAKHYGCKVVQNADGAYKFKDASDERHGTAQQQWDRKIDPYHKRARSNRGGNRSKTEQVTPRKTAEVKKLLAMFNDLSAAERAAFLAEAK